MSSGRPGKPIENAFAESFNGRMRDECLNEHWFDLAEARSKIGSCRADYKEVRPHSALGNRTPTEYALVAQQPAQRCRRFDPVARLLPTRPAGTATDRSSAVVIGHCEIGAKCPKPLGTP